MPFRWCDAAAPRGRAPRSGTSLVSGLNPFLTIAAVASILFGCRAGDHVLDLGTQAVVVGIDGADWKIIDRLAAEGHLPAMASLRDRGVWGEIETLHDIPLSPVIWTSVATAKKADKHGVTWFMVDRPDGTRAPVRSTNRKVKAIWNILAEHRRRPTVIGWWATYPAEEIGRGVLVSDAIGFHGFGATARDGDDGKKTYPASLFETVSLLVPPEQQITADYARRFIHIDAETYSNVMFSPARHTRHNPFNPIHLFQQYAVTAEGYTAIAEELLEERPFDLFMVYYEQVDSLSHLFMKYAPPKLEWIETEPYERFRDVVTEWYKHQDALLGRLLARIDLEKTAVFVLSDHGFKSGERRIRSEEVVDVRKAHLDHEPKGIFIAAGPKLRKGVQVDGASVLDVTPTVLHYLGLPVAQDMDGKVLDTIFEDEFLGEHPIRYIASYEAGSETERGREAANEPTNDSPVEENLDQLRALGYLETPSESGLGSDGAVESSPEIHNNLGRVYLQNGEPDKARREFEKALELDPDNADALLSIAQIHRVEGRVVQAEQLVKRALQADPNSIGALSQLAEIKRDLDDLDEAIRLFREALRIDDSQPFVHLGLGDVLQRAGQFEEAERAFRHVLELDPDSAKAYYNLGATYGNQGRLDEAVICYERSLELAPQAPEAVLAHNNLGVIHLNRGEVEQAAERFAMAVKASPFHLESRYNLALIYLDESKVDEAISLLENAARIQPNHELVTLRLGLAYLRKGRNEDAFKSFLLVRRLYPQNWNALLGLALLHLGAGQEEQARASLDEALRLGGDVARNQAKSFPRLDELISGR
ncbi:MAG TPA: tetratricopeptide repeat protein [Vicinamibacteria bacterium]|nr:tetratricopeptide repeat protein [Vicinamibacteria bacterium]